MIKALLLLCGVIAALALGSIAFLPTLLTTQWIKNGVIELLNERIPGTLQIEKINVGWFNSLKVDGLTLADSDGVKVFAFKKLESSITLWDLLRGREIDGDLIVKELSLEVKAGENGSDTLAQSLGVKKILSDQLPLPLTLHHVDLMLRHSPDQLFTLNLSGTGKHIDKESAIEVDLSYSPLELSSREIALLDDKSAELNLSARLQQFPLSLLSELFPSNSDLIKKAELLIGKSNTALLKGEYKDEKGTFSLSLEGEIGHLIAEGAIEKGQFLLLKPLALRSTITPQLIAGLAGDSSPQLKGIVSSDQQLLLTVTPQQFSFELRTPYLQNIHVGSGSLQLGNLTIKNEGEWKKVASLVKISDRNTFEVRVTPIYFALSEGIMRLERFDLLVSETLPAAAWGNINLITDQIDMRLAIPFSSVATPLNITPISSNDPVVISIKGKSSSPEVQTSGLLKEAGAKLGTVAALQSATLQGAAIGTLLGTVINGKKTKIPPPTTDPLPWENKLQPTEGGKGASSNKLIEEIAPPNLFKKFFK